MSQEQGTAAEQDSVEAAPREPVRWHRHRWSVWKPPYFPGGFVNVFNGGGTPRQQRSCDRCGIVQDRSCVFPAVTS